MKKLVAFVKATLHYSDTRPATVISILSGYLWAICLMFPGETISRPIYKYMNEVMGETAWTLVFLSAASLQLYRLWMGSHNKFHRTIDFAIKLYAMAMWTFVALACMLSAYPPAAAMSDTLVVAAATWWDFLRHDPHYSDRSRGVNNGGHGP